MKPAQVDRRSRIMTPLRLPPELRFLQRWNVFSSSWQLCHTSKIFPIDTFVALNGVGICRVVSDPVYAAAPRISTAHCRVVRRENLRGCH